MTPGAGLISNLVTIGPGSTSSTVASIPKSFNFNSSSLERASSDSSELPYFSLGASSNISRLGREDDSLESNNFDCLCSLAFAPSSIIGLDFSIFGFVVYCLSVVSVLRFIAKTVFLSFSFFTLAFFLRDFFISTFLEISLVFISTVLEASIINEASFVINFPIDSMTVIQEKPIKIGIKQNQILNMSNVVPIILKLFNKEEAIAKPNIPPAPSGIQDMDK